MELEDHEEAHTGHSRNPANVSRLNEYYSDKVFPRMRNMGYKAVRTERWKYIHYLELNHMDELYDLKADRPHRAG